jgi:hypothetical protein
VLLSFPEKPLVKEEEATHVFIIIIMALQPFVGFWPLFQFLDPKHIR